MDVFAENLGMALVQRTFRQKWQVAIARSTSPDASADWDGVQAHKELKRLGVLSFVSRSLHFSELLREISVYDAYRHRVAFLNQMYAAADTALSDSEKRFRGLAHDFRKLPFGGASDAATLFNGLAEWVETERKNLSELNRARWAEALKSYPLTKQDFDHVLWVPNPPMKFEMAFDDHLHDKVRRSQSLPKVQNLIRGFDLDRQFQLRVAAMLSSQFPALSKATLSRLVVLTYICAGLVEHVEGGIKIPRPSCKRTRKRASGGNAQVGTPRDFLTPTGVYHKLKHISLAN